MRQPRSLSAALRGGGAHALSEASRRAFARYWLVIKPMGNFVSWLLLRAVRRRAQAAPPFGP